MLRTLVTRTRLGVLSNSLFANKHNIECGEITPLFMRSRVCNCSLASAGVATGDIGGCQPPGCGRVERRHRCVMMMPGGLSNISLEPRTV